MRPFHNQPMYKPENDISHLVFMGIAVIFWAAVIFGLVLLLNRYARRNDMPQTAVQDPIDIVKARYAKGEITKEEFVQLKKDLS